jgi:hypothetical protein
MVAVLLGVFRGGLSHGGRGDERGDRDSDKQLRWSALHHESAMFN